MARVEFWIDDAMADELERLAAARHERPGEFAGCLLRAALDHESGTGGARSITTKDAGRGQPTEPPLYVENPTFPNIPTRFS